MVIHHTVLGTGNLSVLVCCAVTYRNSSQVPDPKHTCSQKVGQEQHRSTDVSSRLLLSFSPQDVANALLPMYAITLLFFAGFLFRFTNMPPWWKVSRAAYLFVNVCRGGNKRVALRTYGVLHANGIGLWLP